MDRFEPWPDTDPLGEALHFLRMNGTFYCRSELSAPWGLTLPPMDDCLWLHVVTAGGCGLQVDGGRAEHLQPQGIALIPHGNGHCLRSAPGVPAPSIHALPREQISARYEVLRYGGGGAVTSVICGGISYDDATARDLFRLLPPIMYVDASGPDRAPLQRTLEAIAAETRELRPGSAVVIARLADVLVVQAMRSWIETTPAARAGWLGALQDRHIGRAMSLIHRDPARAWSVATLASELAMSRSAFAARFTQLVNEPVMQYVTRRRMQVARRWLEEDRLTTVVDVANRLGYESEAAFRRAFKRVTGVSPGTVRAVRSDAIDGTE